MGNSQGFLAMKMKVYTGLLSLAFFLSGQLRGEISEARKKEITNYMEIGDYSGGSRSEEQPFADWIMRMTSDEKKWTIPLARKERDHWNADQMPELREAWNGVLAYLGDD